MKSLDELAAERKTLVTTTTLRVAYLNTLRDIVGRRCEKNRVGAALVSDYDLLDASPEEITEAIAKLSCPPKPTS